MKRLAEGATRSTGTFEIIIQRNISGRRFCGVIGTPISRSIIRLITTAVPKDFQLEFPFR